MSKKYIKREVESVVLDWINRPEVIAIKGPRQAGKTTLLEALKNKLNGKTHYFSFEDRDTLKQFEEDPLLFIENLPKEKKGKTFVLLDEYQYVSDGGQKLKFIYDELKEEIKFIITGSSSLELRSSTAEYMVGRMLSVNLLPFSFEEFLRTKQERFLNLWQKRNKKIKKLLSGKDNIDWEKIHDNSYDKKLKKFWREYCLYGGYPAVVTEENEEIKKDILSGLRDTYIDRDIVRLLDSEDIKKFRDLIKIIASQSGQILNYNQLSNDIGVYYKKVKHFLSILEETYLIKRIHPFHKNLTTELKKTPKCYFFDSGLRNCILNNYNNLDLRPDKGEIVEGVSLMNVISSFRRSGEVSFWRTAGGAEVDFIVKDNDYPVEVKYRKNKFNVSRSLISFIKSYDPETVFILTDGSWKKRSMKGTNVFFVPVWQFSSSLNFFEK